MEVILGGWSLQMLFGWNPGGLTTILRTDANGLHDEVTDNAP